MVVIDLSEDEAWRPAPPIASATSQPAEKGCMVLLYVGYGIYLKFNVFEHHFWMGTTDPSPKKTNTLFTGKNDSA